MYFDVSVVLLMVLMASSYMDSAPASGNYDSDFDPEWDQLFGHLSEEPLVSRVTKPDKFFIGKNGQPKPSARPAVVVPQPALVRPQVGPAPPAPPFVFNPNSKEKIPTLPIPSIGANSEGNMEGIAISQNRGIALGIYMVNSTYNNFNTVFGTSNVTQNRKYP